MVGLVFVSHIRELSKGVIALARLVGPDVPMEEAGGLEDGSAGTDMERIASAIENADQGKGVLIFMDLGSAVMSTEMALELNPNPAHIMVDAPFVESAVVAAAAAQGGASAEEILFLIESQKDVKKF
ncbi:MAG: PTS-dependent dihydroxyacetone kinase phosphotransferase subunit DhaM [Clostridiaceae bacterium]|jgi:PTS hybrid protein|nr:PTS-dependent dihydroxyacetone kinase phosphotransferase subunit DhaM [Clostridiaceae bacterium]